EIAFLEGQSTKFVANRENKSKKIAWVHTDLEKHRKLRKSTERKAYGLFDKIIAVSNDSGKSIEKLYPEYKHKVEIITNPIDTEVIKKMAKIDEISYPNNVFNFIAVGSLKHVKGYDILLNAHEELIREGIVHHLYI